ncbi:hypothetical protein VTI74DRAFT_9469 [Chaetomium olivicolor]
MFFADMLLYAVSRFFFCTSILLFYLRVFSPKADDIFRRLLIGSMVLNSVGSFAFIMAIIFQCRPLPYFWLEWEALHDGYCGNYNITVWVAATAGIVFDIWMLALPLSQLMALSLPWRKKLVGGLMFFSGVGVMIVNLVRLKTISEFTRMVNPTIQICLWSGIELDVNVICPCLPSFRLLLQRLLPRLMGSSPSDTPSTAGNALDPALCSPSPIEGLSGQGGSAARTGSQSWGGGGGGDGGTTAGERAAAGGNGGGCCCYVGAQIKEAKTWEVEDVVAVKYVSDESNNGSILEQVEGWSSAGKDRDLQQGRKAGGRKGSR